MAKAKKKKYYSKIIIFGSNGQIGSELYKKLDIENFTIYKFTKKKCDITDLLKVEKIITTIKPDIIINAAAYTNVGGAEKDKINCFQANVIAVENLARISRIVNSWLIHFSTDYVFNGTKKKYYTEADKPSPLSIYGISKYKSEKKIIESKCKYLIFRISWIYGLNNNNNFPAKIIQKLNTNEDINVVNNQFGAPTSAKFISKSVLHCIKKIQFNDVKYIGIYHLACKGKTTWYMLAQFIKKYLEMKKILFSSSKIHPIRYEHSTLNVKRPFNSLLKKEKIYKKFNIRSLNWKEDLIKHLNKIYD